MPSTGFADTETSDSSFFGARGDAGPFSIRRGGLANDG